jgi:hypothetical protein
VANQYDLTIKQGETLSISAVWRDSAGDLINLSGYSAAMTLRTAYAESGTVLYLATTNGGISLAAAGTITITAAATATSALSAPGFGVYDLELRSGGSAVTRLLEGGYVITPEVTR